ncbi:transmembrane protein 207 [Chelonia mydas]|uniref:transmembrane protein 207 n=1 Tax=Chelonia mydas TaxID=8469 RepID=UPI0018A246FE|nr:transmembrane protein 207 [Chelonia mydas]
MWRPKAPCLTWLISEIGGLCLTLFQLADSDPKCDPDEACVNYNEESLSVWYVWLLILFFLATILSCGILFCLQCWLKQRSSFPSRRTLAVFALSDSDSLGVSDASPCAFSGVHAHSPNPDLCPSPALRIGTRGTGSPPSYEDIMKAGKH